MQLPIASRRPLSGVLGRAGRGVLVAGTALLVAVLAGACTDGTERRSGEPEFRVDGTLDFLRPDGSVLTRIAIEIAETPRQQATGLMGRRSLPGKGGMLFVNDVEREQQFWMKNTPLPLDLIFIRSDSTIANVVKRTRPLTNDYIRSDGPALLVLEVRAGFTDRMGIDETVRIAWRRTKTEVDS